MKDKEELKKINAFLNNWMNKTFFKGGGRKMAKIKTANGSRPKVTPTKIKVSKKAGKPVPQNEELVDTGGAFREKKAKDIASKFQKMREEKVNKSLQEYDEFYSKFHKQVAEEKKKGKSIPEIAKLVENEFDSISRAINMVYYSLNRDSIISTKVQQRILARHEALRKELKNEKTSS